MGEALGILPRLAFAYDFLHSSRVIQHWLRVVWSFSDAEPCGIDVGLMERFLLFRASLVAKNASQSGDNLKVNLFMRTAIDANGAGPMRPFLYPAVIAKGFVVALDAIPCLDLPLTLATRRT